MCGIIMTSSACSAPSLSFSGHSTNMRVVRFQLKAAPGEDLKALR